MGCSGVLPPADRQSYRPSAREAGKRRPSCYQRLIWSTRSLREAWASHGRRETRARQEHISVVPG
eukprot:13225029-Alexandrium_andersonii.AAC.1